MGGHGPNRARRSVLRSVYSIDLIDTYAATTPPILLGGVEFPRQQTQSGSRRLVLRRLNEQRVVAGLLSAQLDCRSTAPGAGAREEELTDYPPFR